MSVFTNPASSSREQARAYTGAILDLLGDRTPMDVLKRTEAALKKAVRGLTARQMSKREAPNKWSIKHVLQHLADSDLVLGWRMRMILAHERPPLTGYDQDLWADRLKYDDARPDDALREFGVLRKANVRLMRGASADELKRAGVHSERGDESIEYMMRLYAGHDLLHLKQIARIRETHGW